MTENKKLEEIVDLLADYGGFNRDYLKDKLLNSSKEKPDNKNKMAEVAKNSIRRVKMAENKMEQIAKLFGKKLGEEFTVNVPQYDVYGGIKDTVPVKGWFGSRGFRSRQIMFADSYIFAELLEGKAVIVDE